MHISRNRFGGLRMAAVIALATLVAGCGKSGQEAAGGTQATAPSVPEILPPRAQAELLRIVTLAQQEARSVENDMQLGGVKARRDTALCQAVTSTQARDWIGEIKSINSNSDGKGVLEIQIAPDVVVKTWNNAFSDMRSETLIPPGSPVFEVASRMKPHQKVLFSGHFFAGESGDCFREASLSLRGKVREPEFIFAFSEVRDYAQARDERAKQQPAAAPREAASAAPVERAPQPAAVAAPAPAPSAATAPGAREATPEVPAVASTQAATGVVPAASGTMTCNTLKHQIVIDRDPATDLVRYRSWNRPREQTEKPDMEVKPGEVTIEGTGACRSTLYRFAVGKTRFEVSNSVACVEARPPENAVGQVSVFINNELKSEYWCLK